MSPTSSLSLDALLAAIPVAAMLRARREHVEPARLSFGRFFLSYVLLFSALLWLTGRLGLPAALFATGFLLGLLATGRLVGSLYRLLYGRAWLERFPNQPAVDANRWHLQLMILGVLCFVGAMLFATLLAPA